MKKVYFLLIVLVAFASTGCVEVKNSDLHLSTTSHNFDEVGGELKIAINSSSIWSISSEKDWCTFDRNSGEGNATVTIKVGVNNEDLTRQSRIYIMDEVKSLYIDITQDGSGTFTVPLVFHVLYSDANDTLQYVNYSRIKTIVDEVNKIYSSGSEKLNINFKIATNDHDGNPLTGSTPGVEYIKWNDSYPIDFLSVMTSTGDTYKKYLWDPNKYINVFLYNFFESDDDFITYGISHFPYTIEGDYFLEGTTSVPNGYISLSNINYAYCISLNSLYAYKNSNDKIYTPEDIYVTLSHELGHYLGLYHVFAEDENGNMSEDGTIDSDFCIDTPTYNRFGYSSWLAEQFKGGVTPSFTNLVQRTNGITGSIFTSRNIMDYYYSYSNQFTPEQRVRMRHVLTFSPLMPGKQKGVNTSKSYGANEVLDLPIKFSKQCNSHKH